LGYGEGREVVVEERYAALARESLVDLATQLVALKVNVIVASGFAAGQAAKRATGSVPIVAVTRDLVEGGLAASLARPGANATGISIMSAELGAKWVELLRETIPNVSRIAFLRDAADAPPWTMTDAAARAVGVTPLHLETRRAEELPQAFEDSIRVGAQGIVVMASPLFASQKALLVALAAQHRMPAMYEHSNFVEAGGLMSYGPDLHETFRRVAHYVDRILRGAKPGNLPVEQPTRFELVLNMKTAHTLGLTVPRSIMLRADKVID
jgi:putative ABC transport system substrate-binding protein